MKQMLFLVCAMTYFCIRSLVDPFWAILLYYGLAILRPQYIWDWALRSVTSKEIRWSLIAAGAAAITFVFNLGTLSHRIVQKRFIFLLMLFILCLAGSYYYARNHEIAAKYAWEYTKIFIMLILACFVVNRHWHVRYLAWAIFLCLMYLVYEINFMYLFQHRLDIYHNGYGGLDNNGAALLLAMVIPFCFYFFQAERRWFRWGFLLCIGPAAHAVMLTYSRGAMLSALVAGTGMLLTTARKKFFQSVALAVGAVVLVLVLAGPQIRNRFLSIQEDRPGGSKESRFASWRAGWEIAKDYPWFGVGLRNANLLTQSYGADMEGRTIHNVYIQIAADAGIPAGIIYTTLVILTLWHLHVAVRRSRTALDDPDLRWHHFICKAAFWSLVTFAFGAIFLSVETVELCDLLRLLGAVAPALSKPGDEESPAAEPASDKVLPVRPRPGMRSAPA